MNAKQTYLRRNGYINRTPAECEILMLIYGGTPKLETAPLPEFELTEGFEFTHVDGSGRHVVTRVEGNRFWYTPARGGVADVGRVDEAYKIIEELV